MFKVNDKEFCSATEALDYYINNFDFGNHNFIIRNLDAQKQQYENCNLQKSKFKSVDNICIEPIKETNACQEIEKLLNKLSNRIQDYKNDEITLIEKTKTASSIEIHSKDKHTKSDQEEDDPILKSLSRFEDLNKQLSSTNLFEHIDSSLQRNNKKIEVNTLINSFKSESSNNIEQKVNPTFNNVRSNSCENFMQECLKIIN